MAPDEKKCPRCAETVKAEAKVCRYCQHQFEAAAGPAASPNTASNTKQGLLGCLGVFVILVIIGSIVSPDPEPAPTRVNDNASARATAVPDAKGKSPQQRYVEQLEREVASLRAIDPLTAAEITDQQMLTIQTALLAVWGTMYAEGEQHDLNAEERRLREELGRLVSRGQARRFPILRAAQARLFGEILWENDVDVAATGPGNRNIRFTAGMFAARRNVAEAQRTVQATLQLLRFRRATYEWYRGSESIFYDMDSLPDATLARIAGERWVAVSR